jgi:hypothetical protein
VALGHDQNGGDQLLDDEGTWSDKTASAQLGHEGLGNAERARGRECHWQQPLQNVAATRRCQIGKAERVTQIVELFVAGLEPGGVGRERVRIGAELFGYKTKRLGRDQLAGPQQAAGIAQRTKLQSEADPVAVAPALVDGGEIGVAQCPVLDQVGFGNR